MNKKKKGSDNIMLILKSITPRKTIYSKRNKELDKTFKHVSLENLLKNLNRRFKIREEFSPSPEFLKDKNKFEINFKNSNTYIKELSDLNNLPLLAKNKNYKKNGSFKADFDFNLNKKEEQKKMMEENEKVKKERFDKRLKQLKILKKNDSDTSLLKQNSDLDFIKKKVFIRPLPSSLTSREDYKENVKYSNKKMKSSYENKNNDRKLINNVAFKQRKNQKLSVIAFNKNKKGISNIIFRNNKKNNNNSMLFNESYSNRSNLSKNQFIDSNNSNIKKQKSSRNITNKYRRMSIKSLFFKNNENGNSFTNSDNPTLEINKSTNIEDVSLIYHDKKKISKANSLRNISNNNLKLPNIKKIERNTSKKKYDENNGIKYSIFFNKMLGRNDMNLEENNNDMISYNPNYDFFRPHIHSPIFCYKKNDENYKKYKIGKIIRGYNYSSDKYFVFDYNKKKQNKFNLNRERKKILEILRKKFE